MENSHKVVERVPNKNFYLIVVLGSSLSVNIYKEFKFLERTYHQDLNTASKTFNINRELAEDTKKGYSFILGQLIKINGDTQESQLLDSFCHVNSLRPEKVITRDLSKTGIQTTPAPNPQLDAQQATHQPNTFYDLPIYWGISTN